MTASPARFQRDGQTDSGAHAICVMNVMSLTRDAALGELERLAGLDEQSRAEFWDAFDSADTERMKAEAGLVLRNRIAARIAAGELSLLRRNH